MRKQKNKYINDIADNIRAILKEQGVYSELLELAIMDAAQITYLKDVVLDTIGGKDDIILTELTREGYERQKISPTVALIQDLFESSRKALVELGMTARRSSSSDEDEVDKLTKMVNDVKG